MTDRPAGIAEHGHREAGGDGAAGAGAQGVLQRAIDHVAERRAELGGTLLRSPEEPVVKDQRGARVRIICMRMWMSRPDVDGAPATDFSP